MIIGNSVKTPLFKTDIHNIYFGELINTILEDFNLSAKIVDDLKYQLNRLNIKTYNEFYSIPIEDLLKKLSKNPLENYSEDNVEKLLSKFGEYNIYTCDELTNSFDKLLPELDEESVSLLKAFNDLIKYNTEIYSKIKNEKDKYLGSGKGSYTSNVNLDESTSIEIYPYKTKKIKIKKLDEEDISYANKSLAEKLIFSIRPGFKNLSAKSSNKVSFNLNINEEIDIESLYKAIIDIDKSLRNIVLNVRKTDEYSIIEASFKQQYVVSNGRN